MNTIGKLTFGVASAVGISVASPAVAGAWTVMETFGPDTLSTSGAVATCTIYAGYTQIHSDTAMIVCSLSDTQADGNSVYVGWKQDSYATVSLYNVNGNGSTISFSDARYNPDGSFGTLQWKVCRDMAFSDNCSSWVTYHPK